MSKVGAPHTLFVFSTAKQGGGYPPGKKVMKKKPKKGAVDEGMQNSKEKGSSGGTSIHIFGGQRGERTIFRGVEIVKKKHMMHTKICHFYAEIFIFSIYAEIIKICLFFLKLSNLGIILTHLKLFWGGNWGKNFWGENDPKRPCGVTAEGGSQV